MQQRHQNAKRNHECAAEKYGQKHGRIFLKIPTVSRLKILVKPSKGKTLVAAAGAIAPPVRNYQMSTPVSCVSLFICPLRLGGTDRFTSASNSNHIDSRHPPNFILILVVFTSGYDYCIIYKILQRPSTRKSILCVYSSTLLWICNKQGDILWFIVYVFHMTIF